jgi:uncharacterized protein YdeI (YjbR/CyaY-like superfamily)
MQRSSESGKQWADHYQQERVETKASLSEGKWLVSIYAQIATELALLHTIDETSKIHSGFLLVLRVLRVR